MKTENEQWSPCVEIAGVQNKETNIMKITVTLDKSDIFAALKAYLVAGNACDEDDAPSFNIIIDGEKTALTDLIQEINVDL